jgi:hypothetical protein
VRGRISKYAAAVALNYFLLQLHKDSPYTSHVPSNGRWRDGSDVERREFSRPLGILRATEGGKSGVNEKLLLRFLGDILYDWRFRIHPVGVYEANCDGKRC